MSAFEYYVNAGLSGKGVNGKQKRKRKLKNASCKKPSAKNIVEKFKKSRYHDLNSIYNLNLKNSTKTGQKLLEWLIHPIDLDEFMK